MSGIGIIANPASGKDIRRLVSFATVIDNNEKLNIVERIVLAAQFYGVDTFYFMPDSYQMGLQVQDALKQRGVLTSQIELLPMKVDATAEDTTRAARMMEDMNLGCVVILGGDGTSRAAAKGLEKTPILPLSTGTNNVYPRMLEGTVAGMAAAAITLLPHPYEACIRDKRIEVWINDELVDIALIDAVISNETYQGARAIWNQDHIEAIVVSRSHPASIGFSSVAGSINIIDAADEGGFALRLTDKGRRVKAALSAGVIEEVGVADEKRLADGEWLKLAISHPGIIALDGEREVPIRPGNSLAFRICRNGPWRILPEKAIEMALMHS